MTAMWTRRNLIVSDAPVVDQSPQTIKIPIQDLQKRKLFLATPMYGGMCHGMYARSLANLSAMCARYGIELQIYMLFNESLITRARAYCCDEFVRSTATHLLFLDSDIGYDAQDVIAMLAMMGDDSPYDVLAAPYPKKCISWEKIKQAVDKGFADNDPSVLEKFVGDYVFNPKAGTMSFRIDQPVEVLEAGTGFMMIRRPTLERWQAAFPEYTYRPDHVRTDHFDGSRMIHMFFQAEIDRTNFEKLYKIAIEKALKDPENAGSILQAALSTQETRSMRYLSEDYFFSQKCQEIDMKIFLCPWMRTQHAGSFVFGGSLHDLAQLGAAATADINLINDIKNKKKAVK
jgi:hypothetical protein